jgi:hypothetical protein
MVSCTGDAGVLILHKLTIRSALILRRNMKDERKLLTRSSFHESWTYAHARGLKEFGSLTNHKNFQAERPFGFPLHSLRHSSYSVCIINCVLAFRLFCPSPPNYSEGVVLH